MPIVGFNFDKILAEKKEPVTKDLKIKPDVTIEDVKIEEFVISSNKKEKLLKIVFDFSTEYLPKIGIIQINGHILYSGNPKEIEELSTNWKKNKNIKGDIFLQFINSILIKCNIKALSLSQEVNLPPPLRLPTMAKKVDPKDYIG